MSDFKNKHFQDGMYNHFGYGGGYNLDEKIFSDEMKTDINEKTGLEIGSLGDWWISPMNNPQFTWPELITLSLNILNTEATRLLVHNLYLKEIPKGLKLNIIDDLPISYVGGAKRVNFSSGEYRDYTGAMGIEGLFNPNREAIFDNPPVRNTGKRFRGSGKDEGCCVEGTWYDWVCLACNVLASENTKIVCEEVYEPNLKNDNY